MARILFTLPRFHTNLWFATRAMVQAGHEVRLLVNKRGANENYDFVEPLEMGKYPSRAEVGRRIAEFTPDIAVLRNAFALSRRAASVARQRGLPAVLYNLTPANQRTRWMRRLDLWRKGLPSRRITPSRGLPPDDPVEPLATWLPWPVSAIEHSPPKRPRDRVSILCVGKLGMPRKNHLLLIEAIIRSGLQDRVILTLTGTIPSEADVRRNAYFKTLRAAIDGQPWIVLEPPRPFLEMGELFAASDICVLPSRAEPLGAAPVEAMAYGAVPVISNECGSAGHLVHGTDGFVFDVDKPDELGALLTELVGSAQMRRRMSDAARATAYTTLSEAIFLARLADLLTAHGIPEPPQRADTGTGSLTRSPPRSSGPGNLAPR